MIYLPWGERSAASPRGARGARGRASGSEPRPDQMTDSHLVSLRLSAGCETRRCQTTAARPSVCGVMRSACTVGMSTQASAGDLRRAAVLADDAVDLGADRLGELEREHEVHRDVLLAVAAAHGEDEDGVARREARDLEPLGEARVPALVVDARRELGDVVRGRVGLEAADLAEVVDGVARVTRRAAHAEDEEAPARVARRAQPDGDGLDRGGVELTHGALGLVEVRLDEVDLIGFAHSTYPAACASRKNICTVSRL